MKDGNIEILDLDFEYKLWKNQIDFYLKELNLLNGRVKVLEKEHAKFSFDQKHHITIDKQQEALELVKNRIKIMEFEMGYYSVDYPISSRHMHYVEHEKIRDEMQRLHQAQEYILQNIYPQLCYPFHSK